MKRFNWVIIAVLILISGVIYATRNNLQKPAVPVVPSATPTATLLPIDTETPTQVPILSQTPVATTGPVRGQISCNYQIPATPDSYGTAGLSSNWNNLTWGRNGLRQAEVCVSVNGGKQTLMSIIHEANGSRTDTAPWIALNSAYTFSLFDTQGGNFPDCSGILLSSCQIYQPFSTLAPTSASRR
jgi:hypothetical protein